MATVPSSTTFTLTNMQGNAVSTAADYPYTSGGTVTSTGAVSGVIPTKSLGLSG